MKKFRVVLLILAVFVNVSCKKKYYNEADMILKNLTLKQKVGQMLMVAIPGKKVDNPIDEIMKKYNPGGLIYFGYNLADGDQIKRFSSELQKKSLKYSKIPLFISIDQEGGRVIRIRNGVTQFPGSMASGVSNNEALVYDYARILGIQLRKLGINMNLAPVLDVNNNPDNPVINTRSYGSDPDVVSRMGVEYIKGLQKSKCISVGKHFPGHGDTNKDSHKTLPVINYGINRLKEIEFRPFVKAIEEGVEGIMSAHISFPKILKNNNSATISKYFLTDVLRKRMKFDGLVLTDDMEMNAISMELNMGDAAVKSVLAGADIVLISTYGENIPIIFDAIYNAVKNKIISEQRLNDSVRRIIETKIRYEIINYEKDKIKLAAVTYDQDDFDVLKKANEINKEISKEAIYYYGNRSQLVGDEDRDRVFISSSPILKKSLNPRKNDLILDEFSKFEKVVKKRKSDRKINLYFHVNKPDLGLISSVSEFCKKNKIELIILSSGNPFPLVKLNYLKSILFSFSSTDESIRQIARSLNGEINPKSKINFYLGFDKRTR